MLGRVDLFFAAKGFRLICELKIDSGYQPDQIRRYLASGDYVVSVVRAPGKASLTKDIQGSERWLGEVAWSQIDRGLQSLPLGRRDKQQWLDLLAALHADGDFDAEKARGASEDDVRLARAAAEGALERLRRMRRFDSAHRGLLRDLRIGSSFEGRSRGWVPIVDTSGETYWFIGARNARSRRPEIVIDWLPWSEREPRGQRTMHRRLVQEHDFVRMGKPSAPYYRLRELLARDPGADDPAQAVESATAAIAAVIEIGLLRYDARAYDAA